MGVVVIVVVVVLVVVSLWSVYMYDASNAAMHRVSHCKKAT